MLEDVSQPGTSAPAHSTTAITDAPRCFGLTRWAMHFTVHLSCIGRGLRQRKSILPGCRACLSHNCTINREACNERAHGKICGVGEGEGWWPGPESNQRHPHFQCGALPTELPGPLECGPKDGTESRVYHAHLTRSAARRSLDQTTSRLLRNTVCGQRGLSAGSDAGNHSVARSCLPPVCSDRCSTSRAAPSVRPCTDTPGAHIWQVQPWATSEPALYVRSPASQSLPQHDCYNFLRLATLSSEPTLMDRLEPR